MKLETLPSVKGDYHLNDYEQAYKDFSWEEARKNFSWYETGKINAAYEAIDRHADSFRQNKVALHYKDSQRDEKYTFRDMKINTNKAGNLFREKAHVEKGDRVFIFMPRSPELYFLLLGAVKIGAIVGPLFEAFMEGAVKDRLENSEAKVIVTTPDLLERIPFAELPKLESVIIVGGENEDVDGVRTIHYEKAFEEAAKELEIEWMDEKDGFLLHYTSGSTGTPKGVLHVHGAMVQQGQTGKWVLDLKEDDVYWCTADPGWVTGTVYGIFHVVKWGDECDFRRPV